jgi:hypothetical protein
MNNSEVLEGCDLILKGKHTYYNDLQETERTIFLDIACYFSGLKETTAIRIWDFQSLDWIAKLERQINCGSEQKWRDKHASTIGRHGSKDCKNY